MEEVMALFVALSCRRIEFAGETCEAGHAVKPVNKESLPQRSDNYVREFDDLAGHALSSHPHTLDRETRALRRPSGALLASCHAVIDSRGRERTLKSPHNHVVVPSFSDGTRSPIPSSLFSGPQLLATRRQFFTHSQAPLSGVSKRSARVMDEAAIIHRLAEHEESP
ncbi:hypothetical protein MRX96_041282 [Rhipicephalus microplus]